MVLRENEEKLPKQVGMRGGRPPKICSQCEVVKPLSQFQEDESQPDRLHHKVNYISAIVWVFLTPALSTVIAEARDSSIEKALAFCRHASF
jgi:hypothetical protein